MQRKSKRIGTRRRNLIIGIGLLFSCGLLAQLAPDRTVQTEALAPRVVVPTFTSTPSIMETPTAPTKTTPPSRLLIATDTSLPLPTDTPTAMPAPSRVIENSLQTAPVLLSGTICTCSGDTLSCPDFTSHTEAQQCFDHCRNEGFGDIHRLDGNDQDGLACESLP